MAQKLCHCYTAGAVGAPIWACLARVVQPRQLLAVAMLLQVLGAVVGIFVQA